MKKLEIVILVMVLVFALLIGLSLKSPTAEPNKPYIIVQGASGHIILEKDLLVDNGQEKYLIIAGTRIYFKER